MSATKAPPLPKFRAQSLQEKALRAACVYLRAQQRELRRAGAPAPAGLDRASALCRQALDELAPPRPKPTPPAPGEELFPPTYFMPPPPKPAPGLEGCLTNPLEISDPPAGRAALIERILSMQKNQPNP